MEYQLTDHQKEKLDEIVALLRDRHNRIVLKGSAGCGKTVLAGALVEQIRKDFTINPNYNNGLVYVTAPTNKALAVLQSKMNARVVFSTIHSALKLSRYINEKTGQVSFVKQKTSWKDKDFTDCKICILDECSMLNSELLGFMKNYKFPIIFIGDGKQLNPVGEEKSPIFEQGFPEVELLEIIRQGEGNPIIDLSRDIDMLYFKQPRLIDSKGYIFSNDKLSIIDSLAEVNGTDEMKYLSWTNADVDEMNKLVRERRYGTPNKIELEETIVFNTPFGEFYTNKEVKVEDLDTITDFILIPKYNSRYGNEGCLGPFDQIKVKYYNINGQIKIVHEHSESAFKKVALSLKENSQKYGWNWKGFYFFTEQFADIKYNHAISVHKSQGSTYRQAVINIGNINFNKNLPEKQRLLYTAITRASDLIILNNVK